MREQPVGRPASRPRRGVLGRAIAALLALGLPAALVTPSAAADDGGGPAALAARDHASPGGGGGHSHGGGGGGGGGRSSSGPIAIGVDKRGTSYVGFRSGGALVRVNSSGKVVGRVGLDQDGPVSGVFAYGRGRVWVDYGTSASLLAGRGRVLEHFEHHEGSCPDRASAERYGGIVAVRNRVYIASRCSGTLLAYSTSGQRLARVDLPGRGFPRGIAYAPEQSGHPARVFVGLPDSGRLVAYSVSALGHHAKATVVRVPRPRGGRKPVPSGVTADRFGQVVVADSANHAVYLLDANHRFSHYRTLGHPPRASRRLGSLWSPGALAQHPQDGGSLSGNLFLADTHNRRIQRWDVGGYTHWGQRVKAPAGGGGSGGGSGGGGGGQDPDDPDDPDDPSPVGLPQNLAPPEITGTPSPGNRLECDPGTWSGSPSYTFAWTVGSGVAGNGPVYDLTSSDVGVSLVCEVTASNRKGSATAESAAVAIVADEP